MHTNGNPAFLNPGRAARRVLRHLSLLAGCCVLLATHGCGDDVTPVRLDTNIAGNWQVTCQPVNEDCSNFSITFAADGDIQETNFDGNSGPNKGFGEIVGAELSFSLGFGNIYRYVGTLDAAGGVATGKLTNYDYDGEQKTTPATLTRR